MLKLVKDVARWTIKEPATDPPEDYDMERSNVHFQLDNTTRRWTWKSQEKLFDAEEMARANRGSAACQERLSDLYIARSRNLKVLGIMPDDSGIFLDSDAAIDAIKEAIALTPGDQQDLLLRRFSKYSILLEYKFLRERKRKLADLDEAISPAKRVLEGTPDDHPALIHRLTNLGNLLAHRFELECHNQDIDEAIVHAERATKLAETMKTEYGHYLGVLFRNAATKLELRDQRLASTSDLEEAISKSIQAVNSVSEDHPDRALFMSDTGNMMASRYRRTKSLADLDTAIDMMEAALAAMSKKHPGRTRLLYNLGNRYLDRFEESDNMEDLKQAIDRSYKSSVSTPLGHPDRGKNWCSLAKKYTIRAQKTQGLFDSAKSMNFAHEGVRLLPAGDPNQAEALECLGDAWMLKHEYTKNPANFLTAIEKYIDATKMENGPPLKRISILKKLAELVMEKSDWHDAANVYTQAINLWPRLCPRTLTRDDMEFVVSKLSGLASMAALCIMNDGQHVSSALVALESGRGMMAGLTIDSRSDVSDLKQQHEELYNRYTALRDTISSPILLGDETKQSLEASMAVAISHRNEEVREFERVVGEIRSLSGFEHFQQPPLPAELVELAASGPIVCFNTTKYRNDAFIVTSAGIRCLRLSNEYERVRGVVNVLVRGKKITTGSPSTTSTRNQKLRAILEWLWIIAVKPVLDHLGLISDEPPAKLPRIWWVMGGLMGLLPLHAVGSGWGASRNNTASHVVSSYVPTFKALAYSRQKKLKPLSAPGREVLIVSMPKTEGYKNLKVEKEVKAVKANFSSAEATTSALDTPSRSQVLEKLQSASIAHFICHGTSEALHPSNSGLILRDGRLMVRDLAAVSLDQAQIAYLSACSTAENKTTELVDESIHVASAFNLVGFPHVIGTLWPASNKIAEVVAPKFYEALNINLQRGEEDGDAVAYALHNAMKSLWGEAKKASSSNRNDPTDNVIGWAPFIHLGA